MIKYFSNAIIFIHMKNFSTYCKSTYHYDLEVNHMCTTAVLKKNLVPTTMKHIRNYKTKWHLVFIVLILQ